MILSLQKNDYILPSVLPQPVDFTRCTKLLEVDEESSTPLGRPRFDSATVIPIGDITTDLANDSIAPRAA